MSRILKLTDDEIRPDSTFLLLDSLELFSFNLQVYDTFLVGKIYYEGYLGKKVFIDNYGGKLIGTIYRHSFSSSLYKIYYLQNFL